MKRRSILSGSIGAFGAMGLTGLSAPAMAQKKPNYDLMRQRLIKRIPGLPAIDEINPSAIPGIYEVRIGKEIAYSDATGDHLIRGNIIRTSDRKDLTLERMEDLMRLKWSDLPLTGAIVDKRGSGLRKIVVFADPNCGYCKKFEKDISNLKDITVYTVLVPILSPDSVTKSQAIWCAKNPLGAWTDWMLKNKAPAKVAENCPAPMRSNLDFANANGITGTPTIVFEDGGRVSGAMPMAELEKRLSLIASNAKR